MPIGVYPRKVRAVVIPIGPSIAYVPLTKGLFSLIDIEDAGRVGQFNWCAMELYPECFYAGREHNINGSTTTQFLARFLLGNPVGLEVDHRRGVTLDNRKSQLRPANRSNNGMNQATQKDRRYKGVTWFSKTSKYRAMIRVSGKLLSLGLYALEEDAARAYDVAAVRYFGEFARTNFPIQ